MAPPQAITLVASGVTYILVHQLKPLKHLKLLKHLKPLKLLKPLKPLKLLNQLSSLHPRSRAKVVEPEIPSLRSQ